MMANFDDIEASCKEVADFIQRHIGVEIAERFRREKVDKSAILMMTDDQLSSLGVCTIGERLRLKAVCSPPASTSGKSQSRSKASEKEDTIEKVKVILNSNKRAKRGNSGGTGCPAKVRQKETLKFEFGWKHWVGDRYKLKRSDRGGGKRRIDVSRNAGYDECLQIAKKLFFPKGVSSEGHENEMYILLANNNDVVEIETLEDESENIPFSAQKYKELTGFTLPNLYLLTRSKCSVDEDNLDTDESLNRPVFEITPLDEQGNDVPSQSSTLIGSSSERKAFFQELDRQVSESAAIDAAKEADRQAKENERRERISEEVTKAEKEAEALERLRKARELRVPSEPDSSHPRVVVSVRHLHLDVVSRAFFTRDTVSAVYDWIGSLSATPKHFLLSKVPMISVYPDESVSVVDKELLSMTEENAAIPLSRDDSEVAFYNGESDSDTNGTVLLSEASLITIDDKPPSVLLEDDEETSDEEGIPDSTKAFTPDSFKPPDVLLGDEGTEGTSEEEDTPYIFAVLEGRRKAEAEAFDPLQEKFVTVSRHNIVKELLEIYQDPQISQHKLVAYFDEDSGSGDGVLREMYSVFWSNFLTQNCEGSSQFSISITPAMQAQEYVTVGRILTHSYIQCGSFPVQLARASLHQAIFGSVSDDCLLDSFIKLLPAKERDTLLTGLKGTETFPLEEIMDILDDFKESTLPTSENFRSLLIKVATVEFVTKPYLPLVKLREGMGAFWNDLIKEELDALYKMCSPTPERVAGYLKAHPTDSQEQQVARWLVRYTRNLDNKMAVHFVRFCTATDVLLPDRNILVRFRNMLDNSIRPMARTCFLTLTVARNYRSYNQLKSNFDFYLRDPSQWDLSD